jgi:3-hydroxyacyl-CoA dehydrogenase
LPQSYLHPKYPLCAESRRRCQSRNTNPARLLDLAGLDVSYKARLSLPPDQVASNTPFAVADALVESGRLGQKSGSGYYDYEESSRKRHNSQGAKVIVDRVARHLGIDRLTIGEDEIVTRLTCALINEGAQLLQEGIARRSSDIDVAFTNGYGFPAFRGGPMYYADAIGLQEVVESISALRTKYGDYWTPAPILTELASSGGGFSDWQPQPSVS